MAKGGSAVRGATRRDCNSLSWRSRGISDIAARYGSQGAANQQQAIEHRDATGLSSRWLVTAKISSSLIDQEGSKTSRGLDPETVATAVTSLARWSMGTSPWLSWRAAV
ncbi:hypothetical protein ACJRO7_008961 [Eucalyptus globulus]|uniref:Uncharacterized protein n=1 Tax=Eucalyptus globulus TaxID=34317 RepID=A0ABD3ITD6_EUCGL